MTNFINSITAKKLMAIAGIILFCYTIFHSLSLLSFHNGETRFNTFFQSFNASVIYIILIIAILTSIIFHIFIAINRQLINNKAIAKYQKPYPKAIPRIIAWGGASILLFFIIFHSIQMQIMHDKNIYQQLTLILQQPIMLIIYLLGLISFSAHLHHALTNVLQTLGLSSKTYHLAIIGFLIVLNILFFSIPIRVLYA